ncbi:S8 family serine peptidase [Bacillus sp. V5-8f]|uniref:S8 family serine peptidase n=1 Tax=Bacillus sp. V5-8f TaxID=2053044 RepID=UPI000C78F574|nr:S8 family serine peptidase [Bacillus sp. V5-8f]PLT35776.1 hypothetical protein CUU64_00425 [Bacillus sp. V5-8f]
MKSALSTMALLGLLLAGHSNAHAETVSPTPQQSAAHTSVLFQNEEKYNERHLVVKFSSGVDPAIRRSILKKIAARELDRMSTGNYSLVSVPAGSDLKSFADQLLTYKAVESVEPNYEVKTTFKPGDTSFGKQWYLNKINMPAAWDRTKGSSGVTVAVVDGGFSLTHPELKGKFVKPYNAVNGETTFSSGDHATHVSGIIGAAMNNIGTAGIAPNVKIMPVNVFMGEMADSYWVADGIMYAADSGADIINLSLTTEEKASVLEYAVKYAASKGVMVVAAAGNSHSTKPFYPAAFSSVVGVSAVDSKDQLAPFSNYGSYIDMSAPGVNIFSTISNGRYAMMDGTSMASPVISGVSALILSKNPFLTPAETEQILKNSAVDLGTKGWDNKFGYGRIDAYNALQKTPEPMSPVTLSSTLFVENGTGTLPTSFNAHKNTSVSLYVQDAKGTTVRKLITNKAWSGGKVSYNWDGKLDTGAYAPSGNYKITARASNKRHSLSKTVNVEIKDEIVPVVTFSKSSIVYSPAVKAKLEIPFTLNKSANVTTEVFDSSGNLVRKAKTVFTGGSSSIVWNGNDQSGNRVRDGAYKLVVTADDQEGRKSEPKTVAVTVDTVAPVGTIAPSSNLFKMNGKTTFSVKGMVKEAARVTVKVTDAKGTIVRTLVSGQSWKAGTTTFAWNGRTATNAFAKEGNYQFVLEVTDAAGNKRVVKSSVFKLDDIR